MSDEQPQDAGTPSEEEMKDPPEEHESEAAREVKEAMQTVGDGLNRLFTAIGSALRDPAVQEKAKATGSSIVDSVGETLNTVAEQIRDTFRREAEAEEDEVEADDAQQSAYRELDDTETIEELRTDLTENEEG